MHVRMFLFLPSVSFLLHAFLPKIAFISDSACFQHEEWEVLDRKELGTIQLILGVSVAFNISKEKTTKELIDALAKLYEKPSVSNKVFLMKTLLKIKMS
jgi:hypothetical protein